MALSTLVLVAVLLFCVVVTLWLGYLFYQWYTNSLSLQPGGESYGVINDPNWSTTNKPPEGNDYSTPLDDDYIPYVTHGYSENEVAYPPPARGVYTDLPPAALIPLQEHHGDRANSTPNTTTFPQNSGTGVTDRNAPLLRSPSSEDRTGWSIFPPVSRTELVHVPYPDNHARSEEDMYASEVSAELESCEPAGPPHAYSQPPELSLFSSAGRFANHADKSEVVTIAPRSYIVSSLEPSSSQLSTLDLLPPPDSPPTAPLLDLTPQTAPPPGTASNDPACMTRNISAAIREVINTPLFNSLSPAHQRALRLAAQQNLPPVLIPSPDPNLPFTVVATPMRISPVATKKGTKYVSVGERACRLALETLFGLPFKTARPQWLCNPETGYNLELDCYNPTLKLAVEYNGEQHYHWPTRFHPDPAMFIEQYRRDQYKAQVCYHRGIWLIVVPYTVSPASIPTFIRDHLGPHHRPYIRSL